MDDEPQVEGEFLPESTVDGAGPRTDRFTGAFFPQAQNLVVAGGKFKSITNINHAAPTVPSDFRRIPIGDLDLRKEIQMDYGSGVAHRRHGRHSVRRIYSARIHGSKSPMTVALYQGENAEEEWNRDISQCSWLRHPYFVQLYGTASSCGMHAMIFHDEILEKYRGSHCLTVYLWSQLDAEFADLERYIYIVSGRAPVSRYCTLWIRPSTGHLCADLTRSHNDDLDLQDYGFAPIPIRSLLEPPADSEIPNLIPLEHYHEICLYHLSHHHSCAVFTRASVHLGALIYSPRGSGIELSTEIAFVPDAKVDAGSWSALRWPLLVMENGWTRVNSCEIGCGSGLIERMMDKRRTISWLSQANYIFNEIGVTSNHNDYLLVNRIFYGLRLSGVNNGIPPGYLFLCPLADLRADSPSCFHRPECPAYWSLDPSGAERLSIEEADQLGFPCLKFEMRVVRESWDQSVYSGIGRFHEAKGFDPDTQDVARELEYPLFQVSPQANLEARFPHLQEIDNKSKDELTERLEAEGPPSDECHEESSQTKIDRHSESYPSMHANTISEWDSSFVQSAYFGVDAEMPEPSWIWRIVMGVQFALFLTQGVLWLCESFYS